MLFGLARRGGGNIYDGASRETPQIAFRNPTFDSFKTVNLHVLFSATYIPMQPAIHHLVQQYRQEGFAIASPRSGVSQFVGALENVECAFWNIQQKPGGFM
uniref:Uncharacterized protein n=1 Tax=Schistocephalus solidus TaxID=70667 RepID=A0A0X3Q0R2_SCHSO